MGWKAVRELDVGTGTPVHPGELIPADVAEGIGLPDDPGHRSSWIDGGYVRWTDEKAPRSKKRKSAAKAKSTKKTTAKRKSVKRTTAKRKTPATAPKSTAKSTAKTSARSGSK